MSQKIKTKTDLKEWIKLDLRHYNPKLIDSLLMRQNSLISSYLKHLRKAEYYSNRDSHTKYHAILKGFHTYKMRRLSYKIGFQIGLNTCGPGLIFYHFGHIIINNKAKIGREACIYPGVVVGQNEAGGVPVIGDNCFLGLGSKIFGNITIGNNVTILSNSVVTKSIPANSVAGGIPAKVLKKRTTPLNFKL